MIKSILFDFNGIIIDDEPLQLAAYREVFAERGLEITDRDYYSCLGMDDKSFVRAHLNRLHHASDENTIAEFISAKSAAHRKLIKDELPLFPGAVDFIKESARNFSIGIVSMARRQEIDYVLERAKLNHLFAVVISAEDASAYKPDPDCYLRGRAGINQWRHEQGKFLLSPQEFLVIEDTPPGVRSGKGAGMCTLAITNTVSEAELRKAGADVVSRSLTDWNADAVRHCFDSPQWLSTR